MSQAYAKRIRNVAIATSAASAVFLAFTFYWLQRLGSDPDEPRRAEFVQFRATGEQLPLTGLADHERVVVTHVINSGREDRAWTYVIDGAAPQVLTRLTRNLRLENGYGLRPTDITATDAYELATGDLAGLEAALRLLRTVRADPDTRYDETYAIEYFRGGKLIGEERFIADLFRARLPGYERLAPAWSRSFSLEEWESLVTFADISRRPVVETADPP